MAARTASAVWNGDLKSGDGTVSLGSGAWEGKYSFATRFEDAPGTNPEELIGAAHAGCFSMALSAGLSKAGHPPRTIRTTANVHLTKAGEGFAISRIELECSADVPGIAEEEFQKQAEGAKQNCPVSKALAGVEIVLNASLQ